MSDLSQLTIVELTDLLEAVVKEMEGRELDKIIASVKFQKFTMVANEDL